MYSYFVFYFVFNSKGIRDLPLPPTSGDDLLDEVETTNNDSSQAAPSPKPPVPKQRPVILARCSVLEKNKHAWGKFADIMTLC